MLLLRGTLSNVEGDEVNLTQAISNRVFRAAASSMTPIATLTPLASRAPTELCSESGGPGNLDIIEATKVSLTTFQKKEQLTFVSAPNQMGKLLERSE